MQACKRSRTSNILIITRIYIYIIYYHTLSIHKSYLCVCCFVSNIKNTPFDLNQHSINLWISKNHIKVFRVPIYAMLFFLQQNNCQTKRHKGIGRREQSLDVLDPPGFPQEKFSTKSFGILCTVILLLHPLGYHHYNGLQKEYDYNIIICICNISIPFAILCIDELNIFF